MKRLLCLLTLLVCLPALAQTVTLNVNLGNFQVTPQTNRAVRVQVLNVPSVNSGSVILQDYGTLYSDNTGLLQITNAINNSLWQFTVLAPPVQTIFKVLVLPGASGTINASNTLAAASTATFPAGAVAWAAASSDLRYILATNTLPNGYLAFTTNGGVAFGPASGNVDTTALHQTNNLSDVGNVGTAQTNLHIFTNLFVFTLGSNVLTGGYNVTGVLALNGTNIASLFVPKVNAGSGVLVSTNGDGSVSVSTNGSITGAVAGVLAGTGLLASTNSGVVTLTTNGAVNVPISFVIAGTGLTGTTNGTVVTITTNGSISGAVVAVTAGTGIIASTNAGAVTVNTNGGVSAAVTSAFVQTNDSRAINLSQAANTITGTFTGNAFPLTNYATTNLYTTNLGAGASYTNFGGSHGQLLVTLLTNTPYFYVNTNSNFGLVIKGVNYTDGGAIIVSNNQVFYPLQATATFLSYTQTGGIIQDALYQVGPVTNYASLSGVVSGTSTNFNGAGITNLGTISGAALLNGGNTFDSSAQIFGGGVSIGGTLTMPNFVPIPGLMYINLSHQAQSATVGTGLLFSGGNLITNGSPTVTNNVAGSGILVSSATGSSTISTNGAPANITAGSGIVSTPSGSTVTVATNGGVSTAISSFYTLTNDTRSLNLTYLNGNAGILTITNATNQNLSAGTATITNLTVLGGSLAGISSATITNSSLTNSTVQNQLVAAATNLNLNVGVAVLTNATITSGSISGISTFVSGTIVASGSFNTPSATIANAFVTTGTNLTQSIGTGTATNLTVGTALVTNQTSINLTATNLSALKSTNGTSLTTNGTVANLTGYNAILTQLAFAPPLSVSLTNGPNPDINPTTNSVLNLSGYTAQSGVSGFTGGTDGRIIIIKSENANTLVVSNQTLFESTQTNRIITGTGGDVTLTGPMVMAAFKYDITDQRWLMMWVNAGAASPTFPVSIFNGGSGQTTASAALTALGAGGGSTIITPVLQYNNGDLTPRFVFPATAANTDQGIVVQGSPFTSGASFALQMLTSNTLFTPLTPNGYGIWDAIAFQVDSVGWQAPAGDGAGWNMIVGNGPEPIVIAHASNGNVPAFYSTGDATNGFMVEIPYTDGVLGHNQPLPLRYDVTGTNYFFAAANEPKLFEVNQNNGSINFYNPASGTFNLANGFTLTTTNGVFVKSNGKISNIAFDSSDIATVNLSGAQIRAGTYETSGTAATNGFFSSDQSGWNTDGSGGMQFQSSGTGEFFVDNTGIYPRVSTSGNLKLGLSATQSWGEIFTTAIATSGTSTGTITATGYTNTTGTNVMVDYDASSSTITNFDNAGNPWRTNTTLTGNNFFTILQAGGSIKASGGLTGTWHVN